MKVKRIFPAWLTIFNITILSLVFLAGCGSQGLRKIEPTAQSGQEAAEPTGADGQMQVVNEKYGYQLVVPAGWQASTGDDKNTDASADLVLSSGDENVEVRVGAGHQGGIVGFDSSSKVITATKETYTALGADGFLFRHVKTDAAGARTWAEFHFVTTKNDFTFDFSTKVAQDQEKLPAYFQDILSGWQWRVPDKTMTALGTPGELNSVYMISEKQGWALAAGRILLTKDGGENWSEVTPPGLASNARWIGNEFYDADHAWLAVRDDEVGSVVVFHTADGGRTWGNSVVPRRIKGEVFSARPDFIDPQRGWLLVEPEHGMSSRPGELYRTTDGGEHWSEIAGGGGVGPSAENGLPFAGPLSFHDASFGLLSGRQGAGFAPEHPLYMTMDGGNTWRYQDLPLPADRTGGKLDGVDPPEFFSVGGQAGLLPVEFVPESYKASDYATIFYTTGDGGRTWQLQSSLPGTGPASFPTADDWWAWREETNPSGLAAPSRGLFYHTTDGGQKWATLAPGGDLAQALVNGEKVRQLDFVTEKTGWLVLATADGQGTELLRTTDGGSSWQLIRQP